MTTPTDAATPAPAPKKPVENLHVRKAWGGRKTAAQVWSEHLPLGCKCAGCGKVNGLSVWIRTYYPIADFTRIYGPRQTLIHARVHGGVLPILKTIHGDMVFVRELFACNLCQHAAEAAAAQHPSWALVEVRKAPAKADRVQVAVR